MEMTPEDKKRLRGFMFLSEKPMLYVLNISETTGTRQGTGSRGGEVQPGGSCVASRTLGQPLICAKSRPSSPR